MKQNIKRREPSDHLRAHLDFTKIVEFLSSLPHPLGLKASKCIGENESRKRNRKESREVKEDIKNLYFQSF